MNLLVDIGNTRLKWCIDNNNGMTKGQSVDYKHDHFIKNLQSTWALLDTPKALAISSVSSQHIVLQLSVLAKNIWPHIHIIIAQSSSAILSVTNAYSQPEKLGIDRWLGLIALHHHYSGHRCIIDCGTAITIDYLDNKGTHLGGLISPGLQLMQQSLSKGTEHLPLVSVGSATELATSTGAAISLGILFSAAGLIEKTIHHFAPCDHMIITGGDAERLLHQTDLKLSVEPDFILKGLSLYCKAKNSP
jgi:type III pantothenate kinase